AGDRMKSRHDDPLLPSFEERTSGSTSRGSSKVHKPHLDEMHGPESLPYRPGRALPSKPFGDSSKIIQPSNSRESGPEFGPAPRAAPRANAAAGRSDSGRQLLQGVEEGLGHLQVDEVLVEIEDRAGLVSHLRVRQRRTSAGVAQKFAHVDQRPVEFDIVEA